MMNSKDNESDKAEGWRWRILKMVERNEDDEKWNWRRVKRMIKSEDDEEWRWGNVKIMKIEYVKAWRW